MMTILTTPFGRRTQTLGLIATQIQTRAFTQQANHGEPVHKWKLFRALSESGGSFGVGDRALTVLQALLTCHPEIALSLDADSPALVVFPSSRELEARANGMPASTLRRHLAALVKAGLIIRRDSPNGKRYARKGRDGEIEDAYGFDIAPLVARAGEIFSAAAERKVENKRRALLRERITIYRRNIAGLIETGVACGLPGPWEMMSTRLASDSPPPARNASTAALEALAEGLTGFQAEIEALVVPPAKRAAREDMSGRDSHFERHLQVQITESPVSEPAFNEARPEAVELKTENVSFPIPVLLNAFPDAGDYVSDGIRTAGDIIDAAETIRSMLGISPDAWHDACRAMGIGEAAVAVLAILQRNSMIRSPGGYLRALTAKKRAGTFSIGPVVMAQLQANLKSRGLRAVP